ncbi:Uncharacterised protein [Mycobacteroides abscessus]|nr:Uncharacterised protein [Mycobacteroides abscessus]SHV76387.1 Uncharacterised protein [Mycobacteroides abscessus subsp. abscessus]
MAWNLSATGPGSASPPTGTRRSDFHCVTPGSDKMSPSSEGTMCIEVTASLFNRAVR